MFCLFDKCKEINNLFNDEKEQNARESLIELLYEISINNINIKLEPLSHRQFFYHLIRISGLYPYLDNYIEDAMFEDQLVYHCFSIDNIKTNIDDKKYRVLHREQSKVLKLLLEGENVLLSAPTSFGKSYIIDSLISIKKPKNILIIVPTIALLDETRRRIYKKFNKYNYNIIVAPEKEIDSSCNNIFIFTQERAFLYINKISKLDLFIVDEFYKIGDEDKMRSSILQQVVIYFKSISKQSYFICPNVQKIECSFIKDMKFINLNNFKTVINNEEYIDKIDKEFIDKDKVLLLFYKSNPYNIEYPESYIDKFYRLLNKYIKIKDEQNLIYVYKLADIKLILTVLLLLYKDYLKININSETSKIIEWISKNYTENWFLIEGLKYGIGIHNGKIHRFLAQIQIELFNQKKIKTIVATSSIIEGVNTEIQNVFLWSMKENKKRISVFKYKNIIGRAGRMNKYFKSNAYRLGYPNFNSTKTETLKVDINTENILDYSDTLFDKYLSDDDKKNIDNFREDIINKIGETEFNDIVKQNITKNNRNDILNIVDNLCNTNTYELKKELTVFSTNEWMNKTEYLENILGKYVTDEDVNKISQFIIVISDIWNNGLKNTLSILTKSNILNVDDYFKFENLVSYKIYNIFSDIDTFQKKILLEEAIDMSSFVSNLQNVFLPPHVYTLEEFGLPRMLSKTIDESGIIKFNFDEKDGINKTLKLFAEKKDDIIKLFDVNSFDYYFLQYFYDGIDIKI